MNIKNSIEKKYFFFLHRKHNKEIECGVTELVSNYLGSAWDNKNTYKGLFAF